MTKDHEGRTPTMRLQMRICAAILAAAIALTIASYFAPWWGVGYEGKPYDWPTDEGQMVVIFSPYEWDYYTYHLSYSDAGMWAPVSELMTLVTIGLVLAVALESASLAAVMRGSRQWRWILGMWMTVTLLVVLVGFSATISEAFAESEGDQVLLGLRLPSFRGFEFSFVGEEYRRWHGFFMEHWYWGPMWGWWMIMIGLVLATFATYISTADFECTRPRVSREASPEDAGTESERT